MTGYTNGTDEEHEIYIRRQAMQDEQREEWEATRELLHPPAVVAERPSTIVRAAVGDVTDAIVEYTRIQAALDKALPDCILVIQGKPFRKKAYWRSIATAFNLTLEIREEKLDETASGWGYLVVYRATAPNGRFSDGDGSCYASEKTDTMATVHNVRAHAHTRAMNRAISNLVGFGEVSAEEINHEASGRGGPARAQGASRAASTTGSEDRPPHSDQPSNLISEAQRKRLWAIWSKRYEAECPGGAAEAKEANLREIVGRHGYEHTTDITRATYDSVIADIEKWSIADAAADDPKWSAVAR